MTFSVSRSATTVLHKIHSHSESTSSSSRPRKPSFFSRESKKGKMPTAQEEKDFVAHFAEQTQTLPPEEIAKDPRNKELGHSSRCLSVKDFELVRTLGTGVYIAYLCLGARGFMLCEDASLKGANSWRSQEPLHACGSSGWLILRKLIAKKCSRSRFCARLRVRSSFVPMPISDFWLICDPNWQSSNSSRLITSIMSVRCSQKLLAIHLLRH